jgi:hypothetical protein
MVEREVAPTHFAVWVDGLVERFRHAIEDTDLWRVLWNDDLTVPRSEAIVQAVAGQLWIAHCEAAGVDISREANIGRGPVDFKFSAGWRRRALIEVKLLSSRHLLSGARHQLPQYLASERITFGYYVCVGFTDKDLSAKRIQRVQQACVDASTRWDIRPRFIDARPKVSASLVRSSNANDPSDAHPTGRIRPSMGPQWH